MESPTVVIPISTKDLFEDANLVQFIRCMRDVALLYESIEVTRDAAIRGSADLTPDKVELRRRLADVAVALLTAKLETELNNALRWLDAYYGKVKEPSA